MGQAPLNMVKFFREDDFLPGLTYGLYEKTYY